MANPTMLVVMIVSSILTIAASVPLSTSSLLSLPGLSVVSHEKLKSLKETPEEISPFDANIKEYIVVKEPEDFYNDRSESSEEKLFSDSLIDVFRAEEVIPDMVSLVTDDVQSYYSQLKSSIFNLIQEEETPKQEENLKLPMQRLSQIIFEDPVIYSDSYSDSFDYPSQETDEIPAIVIAKTDISTQFRNLKDLNPIWVWAIIISVIAISLIGLVYLFIICQKTKPSDHIQSLSFQSLHDFNSHPGPFSFNMESNNSKMLENRRNNRIGSINLYNIGYDYIYMNNSHSTDSLNMSGVIPQQKLPKQMFKTTFLPKSFKTQRKSSKNTFKQMDELLQAYYSLDITP